jgi:hypothetical protein
LRVGEAVRLELRDLRDSHTEHPRLHVRCGKGGNYAKVVVMQRYLAETFISRVPCMSNFT